MPKQREEEEDDELELGCVTCLTNIFPRKVSFVAGRPGSMP